MPAKPLLVQNIAQNSSTAKKVNMGFSMLRLVLDQWDDTEDCLLTDLLYKHQQTLGSQHDGTKNRKHCQRDSWSVFQRRLNDVQFCWYFCMEREFFANVCECIRTNVGNHNFKSESYLDGFVAGCIMQGHPSNILHEHEQKAGGFVSGEVKLALTLKLLVCGLYMNLALMFGVCSSIAYEIFHKVIKHWNWMIVWGRFMELIIVRIRDHMRQVGLDIVVASNNANNCCIGAIDDWIVKIRKPFHAKISLIQAIPSHTLAAKDVLVENLNDKGIYFISNSEYMQSCPS